LSTKDLPDRDPPEERSFNLVAICFITNRLRSSIRRLYNDRVKVGDLQNRLGFVVSLATQVASSKGDHAAVSTLAAVEQRLERSRLVREDTLCREGMPQAERRWLGTARSPEAAHWNLLSDLRPERLPYAA